MTFHLFSIEFQFWPILTILTIKTRFKPFLTTGLVFFNFDRSKYQPCDWDSLQAGQKRDSIWLDLSEVENEMKLTYKHSIFTFILLHINHLLILTSEKS